MFTAGVEDAEPVDMMLNIQQKAVEAVRMNTELRNRIESEEGTPWFGVQRFLMESVLENFEDSRQLAYNMLPKVLNAIYGAQGQFWESFKNTETGKLWIRANR